jgi:uncharacterized membrane protein YfcA
MFDTILALAAEPRTWVFVLIGFFAQLCDGALGMGFGAISSAVLAVIGLPRDVVSASVNGAKLITGAAGSVAHVAHRNVSLRLLVSLALAGAVGGVFGATVLARYSHWIVGVVASLCLLLVGAYIIQRGLRGVPAPRAPRYVPAVGVAGGVTEALAGVWGPVVTSSLVALGVAPRYAIGTGTVAETFVAAAVFTALVGHIGFDRLSTSVIGLIAGALLASPVAARLVREIPRRPLMVAVGLLVIVLSLLRLYRDLSVL